MNLVNVMKTKGSKKLTSTGLNIFISNLIQEIVIEFL